MRVAHVVVDIPATEIDAPFDYLITDEVAEVGVGSCVLVDFGPRPVVGYVVGVADGSTHQRLKPVRAVLEKRLFTEAAPELASWIASEYVCPLSEAVRLFAPPGGTPKAVRSEDGGWTVRRAGVGPVDDRWAMLEPGAHDFQPRSTATLQRAVIDALSQGPVRVAELSADLGSVDGALRRLSDAGIVRVEKRRRIRDAAVRERPAPRHERLTGGQRAALDAIETAGRRDGGVIVLEGVTGSGKTEVYLQAIEACIEKGKTACVLVPEISLTPQTVGRFRSRFAEDVAVLHSRLSAGERYDQWDLVRRGDARIVVGARSALFAPLEDLGLIVIDEEHETSYKQGSAPRYHARDVAVRLAARTGAVVVLGSASPSMETLHRCDSGEWQRVMLPERVNARPLPPVQVVDMTAEFGSGHRAMFSRPLESGLRETQEAGDKAVLFLNRRGFASFMLCRECGYVPQCESCSTSLTYHDVGARLQCHHCGAVRAVPARCPACESPYLRQFGAGTQRVEAELTGLFPDWPVVRMDADTTRSKGAHERLLAQFESLETGVLLGTQMIAKGLDYPDVTLVGVIAADTTLNLPDFRAGERTYQLLEQVAGRAGRGDKQGRVIVQTYWPDHPAVTAAAAHDPELFYGPERSVRRELGYPPYGRLANVLFWGHRQDAVSAHARSCTEALRAAAPDGYTLLGPSPAPLAKLKNVWRWHCLVKAPEGADVADVTARALRTVKRTEGVSVAVDVDPLDLM